MMSENITHILSVCVVSSEMFMLFACMAQILCKADIYCEKCSTKKFELKKNV